MTLYTRIDSSLGELILTCSEAKLTGLYFADQPHGRIAPQWQRDDSVDLFAETQRQLEEFAEGERSQFELPLGLNGTPFRVSVWSAIARIPFGTTINYCELAQRIGAPDSIRAVGTATGANPLSWIIPCHRVVGKNGSLTGFAGGLARKRAMLDFEAARTAGREARLQTGSQLVAA